MEKVTALSKKVIRSYKTLPDKKQYIEFFTALLSVPVLITVIMLNINSLKISNKSNTPAPAPQVKEEKVFVPVKTENTGSSGSKNTVITVPDTPAPAQSGESTSSPCKPGIGPVSITSPQEGDTISDNPVSIIVNYTAGEYCAAVWSYRLNNGSWSDYDDKSIALYNLPKGKIKIDLRVKSIVNGQEQTLTRNFTYNGSSQAQEPTLLPTNFQTAKTATSSAN